MMEPLLALKNLGVTLPRGGRQVAVLDSLDLQVSAGEFLALVGESGSGKTMAALSVVRLLPPRAVISGQALLNGTDLLALSEPAMRDVRGRDIGVVFQNPLAALNPSHTIGTQIAEPYRLHTGASKADARKRALTLLDEVGIADGARRIDEYPHQFSGGMRQRAMIAIALACSPKLLIADEPTTGLDPIIVRQIMTLLARLRAEHRLGVLFVTHDLSLVEEFADSVHVLYAGRTVETGAAGPFFAAPRHAYSRALLASAPRLGQNRLRMIPGNLPEPEARPPGCRFGPRCGRHADACDVAYPPMRDGVACLFPETAPVFTAEDEGVARKPVGVDAALEVANVAVRYSGAPAFFRRTAAPPSLQDAAFTLARGECLGIVGASGSGKTTLGRAILQMVPYEGRIALKGSAFGDMTGAEKRAARRRIQVVFQDPRESLNPTLRIGDIVAEPLVLAGSLDRSARTRRVDELLERVGLPAAMAGVLPGMVSGGQAQRVAIARALAAEPDIIVLDEPTSSLDVSTQAVLLNLLKDLAEERGLGYLLISHDLAAVSFLAHRIAVVLGGRIVELADCASLIARPTHSYTASLVAVAPHLRSGAG